jgi:hypothetical protein
MGVVACEAFDGNWEATWVRLGVLGLLRMGSDFEFLAEVFEWVHMSLWPSDWRLVYYNKNSPSRCPRV